MSRFSNLPQFIVVLTLGVACGGGRSGYHLPQETALKPFVVPSEEELVPEEDMWAIGLDDEMTEEAIGEAGTDLEAESASEAGEGSDGAQAPAEGSKGAEGAHKKSSQTPQ